MPRYPRGMSHLFEDYREVENVRNRFDLLLELIDDPRRRVFLTRRGEVVGVLLNPKDYEELWELEFDQDMKLCDLERELIPHEEIMRRMRDRRDGRQQ